MLARGILSRAFTWLDRRIGRGSYDAVKRRLDPGREYSQLTYARQFDSLLRPGVAWLDAGCGHEVLKIQSGREEGQMASRVRSAVGCDADLPSLRAQRTIANRVCCALDALPFRSRHSP